MNLLRGISGALIVMAVGMVSNVAFGQVERGDRYSGAPWATRSPVLAQHGMAATAVPQTNPNWTIVVNHAASDVVSPQIERNCGVTALAENHSDIPSNSAKPSNARTRQRVV